MVLADTGPLYAARDRSDDNHDRAQRDIEDLNAEGLSVAVGYSTLCEGYSLVLYKLGISAAHAWITEVSGYASLVVNPTPDDYRGAVERILGYRDQKLTIFDAVTAILSERLELPVWSYDHHFDILGAQVWRNR